MHKKPIGERLERIDNNYSYYGSITETKAIYDNVNNKCNSNFKHNYVGSNKSRTRKIKAKRGRR